MKIDLLLKNAKIFNSYYKKFVDANLAVLDGKVLYIDKKKNESFEADRIVECNGKYLIPGFIDIHMHIESSMITPGPFAKELAKNGVTTIVSEPHEIANVFGMDGVNALIDASNDAVIDIFHGIPSSVPSTSADLETTGGVIDFDDMVALSKKKEIVCVGEVMNYTRVIKEPELEIVKFINHIKKENPNYIIEGHCPRLVDLDLAKFLYLGIDGDHTEHTLEELIQRFENGMFVEIQAKMLHKELLDHIKENNLYEHFCFVTDDVMADELVENGHLNLIVKNAIEKGMRIEDAIYCASFTPAKRMNFRDRGVIAPGKLADFMLVDNLETLNITDTYKSGKLIYSKNYEIEIDKTNFKFEEKFYKSVKLDKISKSRLDLKANIENGTVTCRVMEVNDGGTSIKEVFREIEVKNYMLNWENSDCLLIAVFERYGKNNTVGLGLVTGNCIKCGAVATTYAHDSHNLLVIGKSIEDILVAANKVIEFNGGIVVVKDENIIGSVELKVAGLLSDKTMAEIGEEVKSVKEALVALGYDHYNPIMSLCTLSLPVSPDLRITNKGLINVIENKVVPLIVE